MEISRKHAGDLEAKLKAAEKALEEANSIISSKTNEVAEIKSQVASREAEICLRLDALNSSFTKKVGTAYQMPADQCKDLLLDSLTILEVNSVRVCNVLVRARRAFSRFFGHLFPKQKDPVLAYHRSATKSGLQVAMAMVMAHDEVIDWEKVRSSHATKVVGAPKSLAPFIRKVKVFSKKMIPLVQPTDAPPKDPFEQTFDGEEFSWWCLIEGEMSRRL